MQVNDKVEIVLPEDADLYKTMWWPKRGKTVTGTVQKLFKNGKVAVAVHQLRQNDGGDGFRTLHFDRSELQVS